MDEFGLTLKQTRIMFCLQYQLVLSDINFEQDGEKASLKREWLSKWKDSTEIFLKNQSEKKAKTDFPYQLITHWSLVKEELRKIRQELGNRLTLCLILLEVILFTPYYPLGTDLDNKFKYLKIYNQDQLKSRQELIAGLLGLDDDYVKRFKSNYKDAINGISGKGFSLLLGAVVGTLVLAVTAAFFTPVIAALLAPILAPGLSGAAAVSAVLAALGGGAIAVGGFGMAGGFAVLVAGGAILGGSAGAGIGALFAQSPNAALTQAAKLEVVMREIIFIQKDIRFAQEIIKEQRQAIRSLEDQLDNLLLHKEKHQGEIENLKKAIDYLKKALERNQDFF